MRIGSDDFAPAGVLDVGIGLEDRLVDRGQLSLAHGELSKLRPAEFEVSFAPALDLESAILRDSAPEGCRLEFAPKSSSEVVTSARLAW